ncbi:nucleotide exchange factor GrpE [Chitinophagaceae bacterium IBVUCB1]|nr:nucleotide exchange factor GrpE [Chitinophagaceae bacterium IBVUCB1]
MSEQTSEKEQVINENADNLSATINEEALAASINTDDSVNGMQHLDDEIGEESELEKLQVELDETKDKYMRLVAEFDNFRKRNAKERIELIQTAGKDVIQSLLDVLDDSERAQKQMETSEDLIQIKEGINLVFNKLQATLQHKGLKKMEAKNHAFDADLHEAITEIPAPNEDMVGKVIDEVQPGYYLNDKLIRFAKVVVGK